MLDSGEIAILRQKMMIPPLALLGLNRWKLLQKHNILLNKMSMPWVGKSFGCVACMYFPLLGVQDDQVWVSQVRGRLATFVAWHCRHCLSYCPALVDARLSMISLIQAYQACSPYSSQFGENAVSTWLFRPPLGQTKSVGIWKSSFKRFIFLDQILCVQVICEYECHDPGHHFFLKFLNKLINFQDRVTVCDLFSTVHELNY